MVVVYILCIQVKEKEPSYMDNTYRAMTRKGYGTQGIVDRVQCQSACL